MVSHQSSYGGTLVRLWARVQQVALEPALVPPLCPRASSCPLCSFLVLSVVVGGAGVSPGVLVKMRSSCSHPSNVAACACSLCSARVFFLPAFHLHLHQVFHTRSHKTTTKNLLAEEAKCGRKVMN